MIETLDGIKETVNYGELKGIKLYDNTYYESYPSHWHTAIEILMPLQNTYEVTCNNTLYTLMNHDILFINSGVIHSMSALAGERLIFQVDRSLLQPALSLLPPDQTSLSSVILVRGEEDLEIHERLKKLLLSILDEYRQPTAFSGMMIYSMFVEIFALLCRKSAQNTFILENTNNRQKEYTEKFMQICDYIKNHCTEDLHLESMANLAGFSKYHFSRLFKDYTGMSFYRFLNIKRIELAETLLMDPEKLVTQVAMQAGFSNLTSFIRMFKLIRGRTPTDFRNMQESQ